MEAPIILGVDIGGSHVTAALVDVEKRLLIEDSLYRRTIDSRESSVNILDACFSIISKAYTGYETLVKHIGIAFPGPFDYENGVCLIKEQDKFQSLYQLSIRNELAQRLAMPPLNIQFINDAAGFLQGEVFAGSARGSNHVLGFTLGTGLGSAISKNGEAVDAALWDSRYLESIAEDYLSTKWFIKRYHQLSGNKLGGVKELTLLLSEDNNAKQVFKEFGTNLAQFIMPLIREHEADMVILGGNIAQAFPAFSADLLEVLNNNQFDTKIEITKLNEYAALIGAASFCQNELLKLNHPLIQLKS